MVLGSRVRGNDEEGAALKRFLGKLHQRFGAGFDLAQPSQDRIAGPQAEFGIYKPLDLAKIKADLFVPALLEASKKNTTIDGKVYGVAHQWGTSGLVVSAAALMPVIAGNCSISCRSSTTAN